MSGSRAVALLALGVVLAAAGAVWLTVGTSTESEAPSVSPVASAPDSPTASDTSLAATNHPTVSAPPRRERVRAAVESSRAPSGQPPAEPVSPLDAVRPLPGEDAAWQRSRVGGSLSAVLDRVLAPGWSWMNHSNLAPVYWGWGLEGTRAVFEVAATRFEQSHDPRRPPVLLALADTESRLGITHVENAEEHFVEAVLAMDPDWPRPLHGLPRLVYFAGGPNVEPWTSDDFAQVGVRHPGAKLWVSSGAGGWDGGSPLPWTEKGWGGEAFFNWALTVAADTERPERAMAATIWVHAVTSRHNWQRLPHDLVAAASFRAMEDRVPPFDDRATPPEWSRAFEARRAAARESDTPWASALDDVTRRIAEVQKTGRSGGHLPQSANPLAIWSLSDEFARRFTSDELERRFPGIEFPRAEALRKLAAHLVEFEPGAAAVEPNTK